jgi:hypothetical protein
MSYSLWGLGGQSNTHIIDRYAVDTMLYRKGEKISAELMY